MSAGGTILFAALGGVAGAYAGAVAADSFYVRKGTSVDHAAVGAAVGASLATFIKVSIDAADAKEKSGTLSGPPLRVLGWP